MRNEAKRPESAAECPSKQPAIVSFYMSYQRELERISRREIDEYEGYSPEDIKKRPNECNWHHVYEEDVISCEEMNVDH